MNPSAPILLPEKVPVDAGVWLSVQRSLAHLSEACDVIADKASDILDRCDHVPACPAVKDPTAKCDMGCADRETRMDALVIHARATQHFFVGLPLPSKNAPVWLPPTREYFDRIVAEAESLRLRAIPVQSWKSWTAMAAAAFASGGAAGASRTLVHAAGALILIVIVTVSLAVAYRRAHRRRALPPLPGAP